MSSDYLCKAISRHTFFTTYAYKNNKTGEMKRGAYRHSKNHISLIDFFRGWRNIAIQECCVCGAWYEGLPTIDFSKQLNNNLQNELMQR